jgi:hypothetical protein
MVRRGTIAMLVAVPCLVPAAIATGAATRTVTDPAFTTVAPSDWHERSLARDGLRWHFFNSGSGHADNLGFAGPRQVTITFGLFPRRGAKTLKAALRKTVGRPRGATHIAVKPTHHATLGGERALTIRITYRFRGHRNVQDDLVALHGNSIAFIETNSPPKRLRTARRAFHAAVAAWRWR